MHWLKLAKCVVRLFFFGCGQFVNFCACLNWCHEHRSWLFGKQYRHYGYKPRTKWSFAENYFHSQPYSHRVVVWCKRYDGMFLECEWQYGACRDYRRKFRVFPCVRSLDVRLPLYYMLLSRTSTTSVPETHVVTILEHSRTLVSSLSVSPIHCSIEGL